MIIYTFFCIKVFGKPTLEKTLRLEKTPRSATRFALPMEPELVPEPLLEIFLRFDEPESLLITSADRTFTKFAMSPYMTEMVKLPKRRDKIYWE